ncbi:MAG: hypothetical protein OXT69_10715 [Candidatus Poribacteria bacterium]|nr:hypothetical protein [Candidatus Poribacteria bacterium]
MKKRIALWAAFALVILAPFIWLWLSRSEGGRDEVSGAGAAKRPAPSVMPTEEAAPETPPAPRVMPTEGNGGTKAGVYTFTGWEDAYDEFARRVGLEFDRQTAEGASAADATIRAYEVVQEEMLNDAEFLAAMSPYIPSKNAESDLRIPHYLWNPMSVLLRSGRVLDDRYYHRTKLPNGEIYKYLPHQELRITWTERRAPTAESEGGRKRVQEVEELVEWHLKRLAAAESEAEKAQEEENLRILRFVLGKWTETKYIDRRETVGPGDSVPDYEKEIIELNLGVIE